MKCFNVHGHTYLYELTFSFDSIESIGYAIDFKEIKRVAAQWIDDVLDHGTILNVKDQVLKDTCIALQSKIWIMSLNGMWGYCNPTVENLAKEIFIAMDGLFADYDHLLIDSVVLYETPNCYTTCTKESITAKEIENFVKVKGEGIRLYALEKGIVNYDDRKDQ